MRELSRWWLAAAIVVSSACGAGASKGFEPRPPTAVEEAPEWELMCPMDTERKGGKLSGSDWWCEKPDGTWHGHNISHYPGGQVKERGEYVDGERDGRWTSYHPGGAVAAQTHFERGKPIGEWASWYEDGTQWQHQNYRDGQRDGLWIEWWSNGNKREQREYRAGEPFGKATWWNRDGETLRVEHYAGGEVVRTEKYVEGKKIVEER